ncbi:hypothetical protein [Brevundimonas sp.]|jgi:hypothetical protein|uniref:hypothetical protein n=1 Tax=Brevundimonas sp. TaxID=1871086 RepID=UPI003783A39C
MNLESKIALTMSADGDSFERVHSNLVKIADEFAIGFAEWLFNIDKEALQKQLNHFKQEKGL